MSTLMARLQQLAVARFGALAESLSPSDELFEVLGIDSLQALDLLSDLEDAFDVEIPDYEVQGVHMREGLAKLIGRRL